MALLVYLNLITVSVLGMFTMMGIEEVKRMDGSVLPEKKKKRMHFRDLFTRAFKKKE